MKLSTLYEARDPKKEAELEPVLTAPFRGPNIRKKETRNTVKNWYKQHGMPDQQFVLPIPKKEPKWQGYNQPVDPDMKAPINTDEYASNVLQPTELKYGKIRVPAANMPYVQTVPNAATSGGRHLQDAIRYWVSNFEGKRWSTLEQAFLNRDWTFKGGMGMYNTARTSLFKYLNNLKEPWPEGEKMANQVLGSKNGLNYVSQSPDVRAYVRSRPPIPDFVQGLRTALTAHDAAVDKWKTETHPQWEEKMATWETEVIPKWQQSVRDWHAEQVRKKGGTFHDDDEFGHGGPPHMPYKQPEPQRPEFWYKDEKWARDYVKSSEQAPQQQ